MHAKGPPVVSPCSDTQHHKVAIGRSTCLPRTSSRRPPDSKHCVSASKDAEVFGFGACAVVRS